MTDDFRIQHSVKTREGDMLNVRAADAAEFEKVLSYVEENIGRIAGLGDLIRAVGSLTGAGTNPTVVPNTQVAPTQVPTNFPAAPAASGDGLYTCNHGERTWRRGSGAKGEWQAMFCPTPKGTANQCEPQWLKPGDPGWRR